MILYENIIDKKIYFTRLISCRLFRKTDTDQIQIQPVSRSSSKPNSFSVTSIAFFIFNTNLTFLYKIDIEVLKSTTKICPQWDLNSKQQPSLDKNSNCLTHSATKPSVEQKIPKLKLDLF